MDVVNIISDLVQDQLPQQDVDDPDQISEISIFVMMHVLNSLGVSYTNEDNGDLFGMDILYQQGFTSLGGEQQYNGTISGIKWQADGPNSGIRGYGFNYDDLYRIEDANFARMAPEGWNLDLDRYSVYGIQYDYNGNIKYLNRKGKTGNPPSGDYDVIDELTYTYNGNRLDNVVDNINDFELYAGDFRDGKTYNSTSTEYEYDYNGNMVNDLNKEMHVTYNHLNLPVLVDFGSKNKIEYLYSATGARIKTTVYTNGTITKEMHYAANIVYDGDELDHILTTEGRIRKEGSVYNFEYFIKDHLGNVRVVFGDDGNGNAELLQEDHYYPYGMTMGGLSYNAGIPHNKYRYNGKEIQADHNLDWYAYGFRMMDPQLGRWHVVDALAENNITTSPYAYAQNNPVNYIDILGLDRLGFDKHESGGGIWSVNYNFGSSAAWSTALNGYQGGMSYGGQTGANYDSYVKKQENGEIGSNVTFTDWYNSNQWYSSGKVSTGENGSNYTTTGGSLGGENVTLIYDPENGVWVISLTGVFVESSASSSGDPYQNSHGLEVFTIKEFWEANMDKPYFDIITQEPWKDGLPGGPSMRMVRNPVDGRIMDMRHVMVVGFGSTMLMRGNPAKGNLAGLGIEIVQWLGPYMGKDSRGSAFDKQDFYSNNIGAFFGTHYLFSGKFTQDWTTSFYLWLNQ